MSHFFEAAQRDICRCIAPDAVQGLWLSQFHRALHNLKHRFEIEIEEAPERNVHGFKGYRLPSAYETKLKRCGMTVRPIYGAEFPCPKAAREFGMCRQHAEVTAKKLAKIGL